MKNILIVEDEMLIASVLKKFIEQAGYTCAGIALDYEEAVTSINKNQIDFVFLDITIRGEKSGLDVAKYINSNKPIPFIYLTSHSDWETMEEVTKTNPVGYISKPFKSIDVITALKLYFKNNEESLSTFKLKVNNNIYIINLNEIIYAEAAHIYVNLILKNELLVLRVSLTMLIKLLPSGILVRVNRGVAINPEYINKISKNNVIIHDKDFRLTSPYYKNYKHLLN